MHVLEGEELGQDAATVEAAFKRHEAISTDIKARVSLQLLLFFLCNYLLLLNHFNSTNTRSYSNPAHLDQGSKMVLSGYLEQADFHVGLETFRSTVYLLTGQESRQVVLCKNH